MKCSLNDVALLSYVGVLLQRDPRVALWCFLRDSNEFLWCTEQICCSQCLHIFSVCVSADDPTWETPFCLHSEHRSLTLSVVTGAEFRITSLSCVSTSVAANNCEKATNNSCCTISGIIELYSEFRFDGEAVPVCYLQSLSC